MGKLLILIKGVAAIVSVAVIINSFSKDREAVGMLALVVFITSYLL